MTSHSIPTAAGTQPIKKGPRCLGVAKDQEVERQVKKLLYQGTVERADSAWSCPVVLVRKKDGSWSCAVTKQDAYPLPRIDDSLNALSGSIYFSTLDLLSGYWQVPMDAEAREKFAFVTKDGLWKWRVLPFGLTYNSTSYIRTTNGESTTRITVEQSITIPR